MLHLPSALQSSSCCVNRCNRWVSFLVPRLGFVLVAMPETQWHCHVPAASHFWRQAHPLEYDVLRRLIDSLCSPNASHVHIVVFCPVVPESASIPLGVSQSSELSLLVSGQSTLLTSCFSLAFRVISVFPAAVSPYRCVSLLFTQARMSLRCPSCCSSAG